MSAPVSLLDVDAIFSVRQAPDSMKQAACLNPIARAARDLATAIRDNTPNCNDRLTALEHARIALFFAREAIEINGYEG